jgi:hypothetical protein
MVFLGPMDLLLVESLLKLDLMLETKETTTLIQCPELLQLLISGKDLTLEFKDNICIWYLLLPSLLLLLSW